MVFVKLFERIEYGTRNQAKIRCSGVDLSIANAVDHPVEGLRSGLLEPGSFLRLAALSGNDVIAFFRQAQPFTAAALALSHGANDAQKTVGLITVGLLAQGALPAFRPPSWVVTACAATIALGTAVGGWSVIRALGRKFYKVRPVHSFTSHLASAVIVFGAGVLGGPVSTSQIVSTTILGAGAAERVNMVRWGVMKQIMVTWLVTMPAVAALAALFYWLLQGRV